MLPDFVHLKLRSGYSVVDSIVRLPELVQRAEGAVALTDFHSLGGAVKFFRACQARQIKPIIGATVHLDSPAGNELSLLCTSLAGFYKLLNLLGKAYAERDRAGVCLRREHLSLDNCTDLIALSGGRNGELSTLLQAGAFEQARALAAHWQQVFPERFYLEIQRLGHEDDAYLVEAHVQLALSLDLPVVATNDVLFLEQSDYYAHEVRAAIANSERVSERLSPYTPEQYLKSAASMAELFADIPTAIANSAAIATRCNLAELSSGAVYVPEFVLPEVSDNTSHLRELVYAGLERRLRANPLTPGHEAEQRDKYQQRLEYELKVIIEQNFVDYFLIVNDFVGYAREQAIAVGPGRGSGAGSLVAYCLEITDMDPLKYELIFERFLNPERKSMPDFDIDFCYHQRERVIDYMKRRYGSDRVGQIIAYGTFGARGVIHDIVRVLGKPRGLSNSVVARISGHPSNNLHRTLNPNTDEDRKDDDDKDFYSPELVKEIANDPELRGIIDLALKLEGIIRNISTHAAGVVIAPAQFSDYCPVYQDDKDQMVRTQWDKDDLEVSGLVKFDFLGLRTLTIIDMSAKALGAGFDLRSLPLDDEKVYADICAGNTIEVFQLESSGMRNSIRDVKPGNIEEIISLISLHRPGPMQFIPEYGRVKDGKQKASYPHPSLKKILEPTYGVAVYQEQVMQIAQKLAGYSMAEADNLRRSMSKKKNMESDRARFLAGAQERGVKQGVADKVFDIIAKFAGYGFNKSHAAGYALLAYQTSWFKNHHPDKFMVAALNTAINSTERIVTLLGECQRLGFKIKPPDINSSEPLFTCDDKRTINYGLAAVRGLGEKVSTELVHQRRKGAYTDLFSLCERAGAKVLNKRSLSALIDSGACDGFGHNRATLEHNIPAALEQARQKSSAQVASLGLSASLGLAAAASPTPAGAKTEVIKEHSLRDLVEREEQALGLNLRYNPMAGFQQELRAYPVIDWAEVYADQKLPDGLYVPGLITKARHFPGKDGKYVLALELRARHGTFNARYRYSHLSQQLQQLTVGDLVFCGDGFFPKKKDDSPGDMLFVNELLSSAQMRARHQKAILLRLRSAATCTQSWCDELFAIKRAWMAPQGVKGLPLAIELIKEGQQWSDDSCLLNASDGLLADLRKLPKEELRFLSK